MPAFPASAVSPAKIRVLVLAGLLGSLSFWLEPSTAQQPGIAVQLPTTSVFSINTAVSVPDGGSISLGGNSGGSWSRSRSGSPFRPFGNQAWGGSQFASNASLKVQIISLAEMEAELLSQLPADRTLADYARPNPPLLRLSTNHTAATQLASSTLRSSTPRSSEKDAKPFGQARRTGDDSAASNEEPQPTSGRAPTTANSPRFFEQVVDPNGSKEVQQKADFMSRHMGRKKK